MPFVSCTFAPGRHRRFFQGRCIRRSGLCLTGQNPNCGTGWKSESNRGTAPVGYFWKAKRSVFVRQMSWRPQYRSSKFRNVYGKVASREHCFDGIPITKNVHDNHFCAVNARFLAIVTESAGGGSFLVIPLEQVRGLAPAEVTPIWSRSLSAGVWTHAPSRECPSCSGMRRSLRCPFLGFSCAGKGGFTGAVANWGFFL